VDVLYRTSRGIMFQGYAEEALVSRELKRYRGKVQLIFTSPPFPLNRKKRYGNRKGDDYRDWLASFAPLLRQFLTPDGSVVIELGNAWEPGKPVMSTLAMETLLEFRDRGRFYLCEQFVAHNRARLPGPAQWVNVERIRVKDSFTHIWWMSPSMRPKANNRNILSSYSPSMLRLLATKRYNAGRRPSEHKIGPSSFLKDNGGSIPSNVLTVTNTRASDEYTDYCRKRGFRLHPSRMSKVVPEFFINFLSEPGDYVLDPFAGSNTTGWAAEALGRRWLSVEPEEQYVRGSFGRFLGVGIRVQRSRDPA
jgi:site-specific DNA-methyltransferase (cytosine-N4-specific)